MKQLLANLCLAAFLVLSGTTRLAAQDAPAAPIPEKSSNTATQDLVRAYLQVQEQIHATQLAIERSRQDSEDVAARNTIALNERLAALEKSLGEQRAHEAHANRTLLTAAGVLVLIGFIAFLVSSFMQMRTMNRFAQAAMNFPALAAGADPRLLGNGAAEANSRLIATIERLENRIRELESGKPAKPTLTVVNESGTVENPADAGRIGTLLGKGQSLLSLGQTDEAIACFNEVLALDAGHTEALVKKGAALEKISKLEEAIDCYDRAIAADNSMTIAYLYKGGVFNRLERYNEALACYEQALKTQEKAHAA